MAGTDSILTSTKKGLGIIESDESFDVDIITFINAAFGTLFQLGVGPQDDTFMIEDKTATWAHFMGDNKNINAVKAFMVLRVRIDFDPPQSGPAMESIRKSLAEYEFRLNVATDTTGRLNPVTPAEDPLDVIFADGYSVARY